MEFLDLEMRFEVLELRDVEVKGPEARVAFVMW